MNDFEEYFKAGEPGRRERAEAWATAMGTSFSARSPAASSSTIIAFLYTSSRYPGPKCRCTAIAAPIIF